MRPIDADLFDKELKTYSDALWDEGYYVADKIRSMLEDRPTVNPYEWISVNDDKPKKNDYYLCWRMTSKCGDKEEWQIDKLYWESNLWLMHRYSLKVVDYVAYWTYLPAPPTEKEN